MKVYGYRGVSAVLAALWSKTRILDEKRAPNLDALFLLSQLLAVLTQRALLANRGLGDDAALRLADTGGRHGARRFGLGATAT